MELTKAEKQRLYAADPKHYFLKVAEELSELQTVALHWRDGKATNEQLAGEIADVYLQLEKLQLFVDPELVQITLACKRNKLRTIIGYIDDDYLSHRKPS
jgi:hypothetical protein